jgi:hypothetical protein
MRRRSREQRRIDANATQCAQCEHWSWGCAWPVDYAAVSKGSIRRDSSSGLIEHQRPRSGYTADQALEIARYRERNGIPTRADTGAWEYPTRALCPGYTAMRRWTKERVRDDETTADGRNISDIRAGLGVVE